jgi:flavodoxin
MGKWGVFYSSVTGNTKMIAEKIAETADAADVLPVEEMPDDLSGYEVVALGYWLRLGGADPKMMQYLPKVKDSTVILFETHGTDPGSEHAITAFARAAYLLGEGCEILGTFGCQGKINPALIEKRRNASPDDPHGGTKAIERWQRAESHPNEEDLAAATDFVTQMKRKLMLRQKYREHKQ